MKATKKNSQSINHSKKTKRIVIFSIALVLFIAFVALSVVWFIKASEVKKEVVSSVDNFSLFLKAQQKGEFKVDKISITGYPFAIKVNLKNISLPKEFLQLDTNLKLEKFSICLPFLSNSMYIKFPKEITFGGDKITNKGAIIKLGFDNFKGGIADIKNAFDVQNIKKFDFKVKNISYIKDNKIYHSSDKLKLKLEREDGYLNFDIDFKNIIQSEEYITKNLLDKIITSKVVFSEAEKSSIASLKEFILQNNNPLSISLNGYIPIEAQKLLVNKKDLKIIFNLDAVVGSVETKLNLKAKSSTLSSLDEVELNLNLTNFKKALTFLQNSYNLITSSNLNKVIASLSNRDVSADKFEYKTSSITDEYLTNVIEALTEINVYNQKADLVQIAYKKDSKQEILNGKKFADLKPIIDEKFKVLSEKSNFIELVEKKPKAKTGAKKVSK